MNILQFFNELSEYVFIGGGIILALLFIVAFYQMIFSSPGYRRLRTTNKDSF